MATTKYLTLPSPAKLNLFFHINGQLEDGYHELQTVFQFLDYGDTLIFEKIPFNNEIVLETPHLTIPPEENLIFKAAKKLQLLTNTTHGVNISLHKILPIGGGLGGGSSNAATTLIALNLLWELQLSLVELATFGLDLGADIPVFVYGDAAWAEGKGEKLQPLTLPEPWYLVVIPNCNVSTASIFSHQQLKRNTPKISIDELETVLGSNDCEPVVRQCFPEVDRAMNWLENYATPHLTGTGGCVFAAFSNENEASYVARLMPNDLKFNTFIARGCNKSPLHFKIRSVQKIKDLQ